MNDLLNWLTSRSLQRFIISGLIVAICWYLGHTLESVTPWCIIILVWINEFLGWQEGLFRGAYGFYRLGPEQKARAVKLFKELDLELNEEESK